MQLILRDVVVSFGDRRVLDGVDLGLGPGELVALMGPSGSGKTTLLSVLAGLRIPDSGQRIVDPALEPLSIGWVFQTSPVLMRRTAFDNVALGPRSAGEVERRCVERAAAALETVRIADLADRPLYTLSGGERQRVVIARALASQADLVIADEPTAALDGAAKAVVTAALADVARAGRAVVVATHDGAVADACQRTLHLVDGRLRPEG